MVSLRVNHLWLDILTVDVFSTTDQFLELMVHLDSISFFFGLADQLFILLDLLFLGCDQDRWWSSWVDWVVAVPFGDIF